MCSVFYGVVVYAVISDDIPNWSLRACRIEWYWHVDVFIYSSSLSLPTVYYTWYTCIQMDSRSCLPYLPTLHDESSSSSRKSQQYIYTQPRSRVILNRMPSACNRRTASFKTSLGTPWKERWLLSAQWSQPGARNQIVRPDRVEFGWVEQRHIP